MELLFDLISHVIFGYALFTFGVFPYFGKKSKLPLFHIFQIGVLYLLLVEYIPSIFSINKSTSLFILALLVLAIKISIIKTANSPARKEKLKSYIILLNIVIAVSLSYAFLDLLDSKDIFMSILNYFIPEQNTYSAPNRFAVLGVWIVLILPLLVVSITYEILQLLYKFVTHDLVD